jgi:hypothetical protein
MGYREPQSIEQRAASYAMLHLSEYSRADGEVDFDALCDDAQAHFAISDDDWLDNALPMHVWFELWQRGMI